MIKTFISSYTNMEGMTTKWLLGGFRETLVKRLAYFCAAALAAPVERQEAMLQTPHGPGSVGDGLG